MWHQNSFHRCFTTDRQVTQTIMLSWSAIIYNRLLLAHITSRCLRCSIRSGGHTQHHLAEKGREGKKKKKKRKKAANTGNQTIFSFDLLALLLCIMLENGQIPKAGSHHLKNCWSSATGKKSQPCLLCFNCGWLLAPFHPNLQYHHKPLFWTSKYHKDCVLLV